MHCNGYLRKCCHGKLHVTLAVEKVFDILYAPGLNRFFSNETRK